MRPPSKLGIAAFLAVFGLPTSVIAAPVVSAPFFLANPHSDSPDASIASSSNGFLLAWSADGDTWAQRYTTTASIAGNPFLLAKHEVSNVVGSHQSTSTSRVEVVSNGTDFAARWVNYNMCCTSSYNWEDFGGAVIRASGAPEPSATFGVRGQFPSPVLGAVASAPPDWVVLDSVATVSTPATVSQRASVNWVASDGATTPVSLFENVPLSAGIYSGFAVASVGGTALAAWSPLALGGRTFALAKKAGTVTMLTDAALPIAADYVVLESNGTDYLVVWPDSAGSVRALRVSGAGAVIGAPIVVWNGSDAGPAPGIVVVKAAGSTYLILLRQPVGADGSVFYASRMLADGTLLDPAGVELPSGGPNVLGATSLTGVADDLWLLTTLDSVNGAPIIRGRYIGATAVPAPPDNVEPPPLPDAGASAGGRGATTGAGGNSPIGSGGDNRPRPPGSGGRSGVDPIDAGSKGTGAAAANDGRVTSRGCGCVLAPSEPAGSPVAGPLSMLALAAGAMRRSRRRRLRAS